jgi:hypothetical protein
MSGLGFTRNAQIVTKQNKEMLSDRKSYAGGRQSFPKKATKLKFKESDKQSLQKLQLKLKKENRLEKIKIISVFAIIIVITLLILS